MKTNIPESLIAELRGLDKTFVVALEEEFPSDALFSEILHTGTGRMRTLAALYRWYDHAKYTINPASHVLIHIGSACSERYAPGSVLLVGSLTNGGSERTEDTIVLDSRGVSLQSVDEVPIGERPDFDLFDTEAYACALFCRETGLRLVCFKGVVDRLTEDGIPDWRKNLKDLQRSFTRLAKMME